MTTRIEKIYPAIIPPTSKQLDRLYGHISNQRGVASEKLADSVLDFLINQGRLIHCWWPSDSNEVKRGIGIDRKVVRQADGMVC